MEKHGVDAVGWTRKGLDALGWNWTQLDGAAAARCRFRKPPLFHDGTTISTHHCLLD